MEITLSISEKLFRKIKVLAYLSGSGADSVEAQLHDLIDRTVTKEITDNLGIEAPVNVAPKRVVHDDLTDATGISDGLGDEMVDDDPEATVPKNGGLTDQDLDNDMEVADPTHEVKVNAPPVTDVAEKAEDVFSNLAGLPKVEVKPGEAITVRRKRPQVKIRGKVSQFTGSEESSF